MKWAWLWAQQSGTMSTIIIWHELEGSITQINTRAINGSFICPLGCGSLVLCGLVCPIHSLQGCFPDNASRLHDTILRAPHQVNCLTMLVDLVFEWMKEWYWWMKYCMHFQLYFNFNYHYLYPTHILPTHLPTYHYSHPTYMLPTYYWNLYLHITYLLT
jgi:hypothetical protein